MWINVWKRVAAESWISCFAYRWCPGRRLSLLLSLPWPWSFTSPLWFLVFLELMYYVDVALRSFWGITKSDRLKIMLIAAGPKGKQTIFIHLFYSLIRILVSRTNFTNNDSGKVQSVLGLNQVVLLHNDPFKYGELCPVPVMRCRGSSGLLSVSYWS